jgi:hypothetical protein
MHLMKKIQAFIAVFSLLVATTGYTIEHHFCNHCQENFETAWFLIPANDEAADHTCDCEHEHQKTCNHSCEINRSVHVEHVRPDIHVFIPSNDIHKEISTLIFVVLYPRQGEIMSLDNKPLAFTDILQRPKIPDKLPCYLSNCVFRL